MDGAVAKVPPLLQAEAARPLIDGYLADEPFDAQANGRVLLILGASTALRALLFGTEALLETAGKRRHATLTGRLDLLGYPVATGAHAEHFGMASYGAPLPPNMAVHEYLSWGARLRGSGRGAALLADAALERWRLKALARRRLGLLNAAERRMVSLAFATVFTPKGLILERPFDSLGPDHAAMLSAGLVRVADSHDMILLAPSLRADGPYASWSQRADTVLLFRNGKLLLQQSGAELWQVQSRFEVEVMGDSAVLRGRLLNAGAEVAGQGRTLLVTLPEGSDAQLLWREAAGSDTPLLRCAPLIGAGGA